MFTFVKPHFWMLLEAEPGKTMSKFQRCAVMCRLDLMRTAHRHGEKRHSVMNRRIRQLTGDYSQSSLSYDTLKSCIRNISWVARTLNVSIYLLWWLSVDNDER